MGVEIELSGLDVPETARLVREVFGGTLREETEYEAFVESSEGTFRIEVDSRPVKKIAADRKNGKQGPSDKIAAPLLEALAEALVPIEVVTPPLAFGAIGSVDGLCERLARAGATGTRERLVHAFGLHFNPDAPSFAPGNILAHVRAFVVLYDWLLEENDVSLARRVTPFVTPFPASYRDLVLDATYSPSLPSLIDDYLEHNPTRNRALDLLPLLAHLDEARVRTALPDEKINERPTYHYRLADSRIGEEGWRPSEAWARWLEVERLASDLDRLESMRADYLSVLDRPFGALHDWAKETRVRLGLP